ncbi:hypothetical protein F4604DRAFT_1926667 [Suillus subluteus]|nr:hypothetical protein F4604DRAFT_1926667 [Suillus subluteus]
MPHESDRKTLLRSLKQTRNDLTITRYMELIEFMIDQILDEDSDSDKESELDDAASGHSNLDISIWTASPTWPESPTLSITSTSSINSLISLSTAYSDFLLHDILDMCECVFTQFIDAIDWAKSREASKGIFYWDAFLPCYETAQQMVQAFNATTTEDISNWAGVSLGTIYNCYKWVMIAILQLHGQVIHFDLLGHKDQMEREQVKAYVESKTCCEWCGGFLCVDGTLSPLHEKPGWHGEGFFDKNLGYSLTAQVVIFPHNLRIVDYVISIPGSLHDSNVFTQTRVSWHPESFFGAGEWL